MSTENSGLISVHLFDAAATYVAMTYFGYLEQHVLPRILIDAFGPLVMFPLKLIVIIPVLYIIDKYSEPGSFKNFMKIIILILGLAPALRDTIRLVVLV